MADYSGYTLISTRAVITPGDPLSLREAGTAVARVRDGLDGAVTQLSTAATAVFDGDQPAWAGPAARACRAVIDGLLEFLCDVSPLLDPFEPLLRQAGADLETAQADLAEIAVNTAIAVDPAADARARAILVTLADRYDLINARLGPIPTNPNELRDLSGSGVEPPTGIVNLSMTGQPGGAPTTLAFYHSPLVGPSPNPLGAVVPLSLPSTGPIGAPLSAAFTPVAGNGNPLSLPTSTNSSGRSAGGSGLTSNPATQLTTTHRIAGIGAEPGVVPTGRPGPGGSPMGTSLLGRGGLAGQGDREPQSRERTRSTDLVGDQDWSDDGGLHGAIGRPRGTDT